MSVVVDHLSKIYGSQRAVDDISFEAPEGKITGFLGPNGAGKSTTMKIATGYISATHGTIHVGNLSVTNDPLGVKRITGYLPEHNPLYLQMYVKEYLGFIASAYQIDNKSKRIAEMIDLCGLEKEAGKKISTLSKGYRQRVGLAQSLIHDPEVLILDEPTSGLDPNQLVEIRKVIREASTNKTVILSTHIMQEVEALCDNVVIINNGKIVADDSVKNIMSVASGQVSYRVAFEKDIDTSLFEAQAISVNKLEDHLYVCSADEDPRKLLMKIVAANDLPLLTIAEDRQSLEGIFQSLTKGK